MAKFGIGQPVRRVEDQRFLTGQGRYVDDIALPGMLHACNVLSPHAHAKIKKIDVSKAKAAPGVLLVLTGADVVAEKIGALTSHLMPEDFGAPKGHRTFQPLHRQRPRPPRRRPRRLRRRRDADAGARRRRAGRGRLRAAAGAGQYRRRRQARRAQGVGRQSGRQQRLPPDVRQQGGDRRGLRRRQARRQAPRREQPPLARLDGAARLPSATTPSRPTRPRSIAANQNPHGARMEVSHIFHVPENRIRVVSPDVGGGFGLKGGFFPEDGLVVWAARKLRRPVKWVSTRSEAMLNDHHAREMVYYGELALDEHGKILGLRSQERCSRWAPISSARRSPPAPSRSASCRPPTTSRPCTSCRRACSPTPRRAGRIAAPAARRRRTSWSG